MRKNALTKILKSTVFLGSLAFSVTAYAGLERIGYVPVNDTNIKYIVPTEKYVNATASSIQLFVSAGLDRYINVYIVDENNNKVFEKRTDLLTNSHRYVDPISGQDVLGQSFLVDANLPDGKYQIVTQLIGSQNKIAFEEKHDLIIDTTPPVLGSKIFTTGSNAYLQVNDPNNKFPFNGLSRVSESIRVNNVEELNSIKNATFTSYHLTGDKAGQKIREQKASYDAIKKEIVYGEGRDSITNGLFNNTIENLKDYRIELKVEDLAGNISTIDEIVGFSGMGVSDRCFVMPTPVAAEVPGSQNVFAGLSALQGFEPFKNGGEVYQNPTRIVFAIPNEYMYPNHKYGYITQPHYTDNENNYWVFTRAIGEKADTNLGNWATSSQWHCKAYNDVQMKPAKDVPEGPVLSSYGYKMQGYDLNEIPNNSYSTKGLNKWFNSNQTLYWEYLQINVEPRPYNIKVKARFKSKDSFCTIEANQSSCNLPIGQTLDATNSKNFSRQQVDLSFALPSSPDTYFVWPKAYHYLDSSKPVLDELTYQPLDFKGNLYIVDDYLEPINSLNGDNFYRIEKIDFKIKNIDNSDNHILSLNNTRIYGYKWLSEFNLSNLPDGKYILDEIKVWDQVNNITTGTLNPSNLAEAIGEEPYIFVVDKTKPIIERLVKGESTTSNDLINISSLDDLQFAIDDANDFKVDHITVKGGSNNEEINLGHRYDEQGNIVLEYPILFPSLEENQTYSVEISVTDKFNNNNTYSTRFAYRPPEIKLSNSIDGKLYIPAKAEEFFYSNGNRTLETESLKLSDGSFVQGRYDVFATIRGDSTLPLVINGEYVEPGKTANIILDYDFSQNEGKLSIPLKAAIDDLIGEATVLISTSAPNSPVLVVDVATWNANPILKSDTWSFKQVIEPFNIVAVGDDSTRCRITSSEAEARASDPIKDPVCLLEWTQIPPEAYPMTLNDDGLNTAGLSGHGVVIGPDRLEYELFIFNGVGQKIYLTKGSQEFTVESALGSIEFQPSEKKQFKRAIEDVEIKFHQVLGPECRLTLDVEEAARSWRFIEKQQRYCFFEWIAMPPGVEQENLNNNPKVIGKIQELGEYPLAWELSIYSLNGEKILVSQKEVMIDVINPAMPDFNLDSIYKVPNTDNIYAVPMKAGYFGMIDVIVDDADVSITTNLNADPIRKLNFIYSKTKNYLRNGIRSSIPFVDSNLYDRKIYSVEVAYNDIPDLKAVEEYIAYTTPNNTVRPEIDVSREAVTTELLPITMRMIDTRFSREGYNSETMGQWEARVVIPQGSGNPDLALTDYLPMVNGEVTTELDIEQFSNLRTIHLQAEARWLHEIPAYEHTVKSRTVSRVNMQSGLPIDGEVSARRISGEAPFTTVFSLQLDNARDRTNIDTVEWQESSDRSNWTTIPMTVQDSRKLTRTFNEGTHYIRAIVTNKFSGLQSQTEHVEIIAYQVVETEILGGLAHFVGSEADFTANAFIRIEPTDEQRELIKLGQLDYDTVSKQPIDLSKVDIEWSIDNWQTILSTTDKASISSEEPKRFNLEARIKPSFAPEEDRQAYRNARAVVSFNNPRAPVVRISGNKNLEFGKVHTFDLNFSAPFRNLSHDIGYEVHYPNGEVSTAVIPASEGDRVFRQFTYELTEEDNRAGQVSFVVNAYIVGFEEETTATVTFSPKTWQYVFPRFIMNINRLTVEVPSEVNVTVSPSATFRGTLDGPSYEWVYPEHFEIIRSRNDMNRTFLIKEAGSHEVQVIVRDARGNEEVITGTIDVVEPKPFTVRLQSYPSNKYNRAPLDVRLKAFISGGHPKDRLRNYQFVLNDQLTLGVGETNLSSLDAGLNKITFVGTSEMGVAVEEALEIQVNANKKPVCNPIEGVRTSRAVSATAYCRDDDGQLTGYEWRINGQLVDFNSRRITQRIEQDEKAPEISVQAIDDSGAKSDVYKVNFK